ncbi:Achaete-scute 1, partial [Bulinus truncatus]
CHFDRTHCIQVKTEDDISFADDVCYQGNHPLHFRYSSSPQSYSSCMYAMGVGNRSQTMSFKENNGPACRRRLDFSNSNFFDEAKVGPMAVAKRNERERNRVKLINMTFHTLRQHLPHLSSSAACKGKSRKLSKVQTLRSAITYIRQLQELVHAKQAGLLAKPGGDAGSSSPKEMMDSPRRADNVADFGNSMPRSVAACVYSDFSKLAAHDELREMPMISGSASSPSFSSISFDLLVRSDDDIMISTDDDVILSTDEDDFVDWL